MAMVKKLTKKGPELALGRVLGSASPFAKKGPQGPQGGAGGGMGMGGRGGMGMGGSCPYM
jgi:hypothetical protein